MMFGESFAPGESGGIPMGSYDVAPGTKIHYDFGDPSSNTFALDVYNMMAYFGATNSLAARTGTYVGLISSPDFQKNISQQKNNIAPDFYDKNYTNALYAEGAQRIIFGDVAGGALTIAKANKLGDKAKGIFFDNISRMAILAIGVILIIGALYLFGQNSLSAGIGDAVKSAISKE